MNSADMRQGEAQASTERDTPRVEECKRLEDARLARGNVRLQLGLVISPEEVAVRRDHILRVKF